jgi:hypothetical protein
MIFQLLLLYIIRLIYLIKLIQKDHPIAKIKLIQTNLRNRKFLLINIVLRKINNKKRIKLKYNQKFKMIIKKLKKGIQLKRKKFLINRAFKL